MEPYEGRPRALRAGCAEERAVPLDYMDAVAVTPRIVEQTVATKSPKTCVPTLGQTVFARELRRVMDRCYLEPVGYLRDFHERRLPPASEAAAAATVLRNAACVVDAGWCQGDGRDTSDGRNHRGHHRGILVAAESWSADLRGGRARERSA